jgi:hypothetical protein
LIANRITSLPFLVGQSIEITRFPLDIRAKPRISRDVEFDDLLPSTLDTEAPSAARFRAMPSAGLGPSPMLSGIAIEAEIASLERLDLHGLRTRWRQLFRRAAPPHLPRYLLHRIIAYRIQANAFGDLDRETLRFLDQLGRAHLERRSQAAGQARKASLRIPAVPEKRSLKPGTLIVREHAGVLHEVTVEARGFAWQGTTYSSLSEVARAITGTRWNGPRFFGLRGKGRAAKAGDPA